MDSIGRWLGDLLDRWPFSQAESSENIITSIRDANPGEVPSFLELSSQPIAKEHRSSAECSPSQTARSDDDG